MIGQNKFTLQTSTDSRLVPGSKVQLYRTRLHFVCHESQQKCFSLLICLEHNASEKEGLLFLSVSVTNRVTLATFGNSKFETHNSCKVNLVGG